MAVDAIRLLRQSWLDMLICAVTILNRQQLIGTKDAEQPLSCRLGLTPNTVGRATIVV
ncbi:MAG: hypothetical protein ACI93R_001901 [Flavobacteriales bacterium]